VTSYTEGFSHFVTSMTAPVASGWSVRRVGLAPTGKRRLGTAHANSGRSLAARRTDHVDPERPFAAGPMNRRSAPESGRRRYGSLAPGAAISERRCQCAGSTHCRPQIPDDGGRDAGERRELVGGAADGPISPGRPLQAARKGEQSSPNNGICRTKRFGGRARRDRR
jgi:hypothetical protein